MLKTCWKGSFVAGIYPFVEESSTDVSSTNNKDNLEELTVRYERVLHNDDVAALVLLWLNHRNSFISWRNRSGLTASHEQGGQIHGNARL